MRHILTGTVVIAVLACLYLVHSQVSPQTFWPFAVLILAGAIGAAHLIENIVRQQRLQTWSRAAARIETCFSGPIDEGSQEYTCTYLYSVNGNRQVGSFKFLARAGKMEEIKTALVGETISVMYDPRNCTKSIVEKRRLKDWEIT